MKYHLSAKILCILLGLLPVFSCKITGKNEMPNTLLHCRMVSLLQEIKKMDDNVFIASKLDSVTDIVYWFKKCMFNELFTFYKVYIADNKSSFPCVESFDSSSKLLNWSYSDNIGPFDIQGGGWCGGNHSYKGQKTAKSIGYRVIIDGVKLNADTLVWGNDVKIETSNYIFNPVHVVDGAGSIVLGDTLCTEFVQYWVQGNNVQVFVQHKYVNRIPVVVSKYYGMQSMFVDETDILTADGLYHDWCLVSHVSRFIKKDFPCFRRFVEKNTIGYQSSYLLSAGLGNHTEISNTDFIFIGNSYGKCYHKLIADKKRFKGDEDYWKGVYTWFKDPISDDSRALCYTGVIEGMDAIYIDCKSEDAFDFILPPLYRDRSFTVLEKTADLKVKKLGSSILKVMSKTFGSYILIFDY